MSRSKNALCVSLAVSALMAMPAFAQTSNSTPQPSPVGTGPVTAPSGKPNSSETGSTNRPTRKLRQHHRSHSSDGPSTGGMGSQGH